MGKNHYANWNNGYNDAYNNGCGNNNGCADDQLDCGCDACAGYPGNECGCNNNGNTGCTNNTCSCSANTCSCGCSNTCGCTVPAAPCGCADNGFQSPVVDGTHIYYEPCDGFKEVCVTGFCQQETAPGRVLDVNATLTNVCPGRRSALGLALTEVDENGAEYARGFQAVTVPAHNGSCNQDIQVDTIRFILPEDQSLQNRRHFIVRAQHHYLDAASIWNNSWGGCRK